MYAGPNIVREGLVLALDAAAVRSYPGSGTTMEDTSGNGHIATFSNDPLFVTTYGGGIACDATSDFLYLDNTIATDYVTVEILYTRDSADGVSDRIIFNKENCWEMKDSGGDLMWAVLASNQGWFWSDTGYNVAIGETVYVSLVYDGGQVQVYVNGGIQQTYDYPDGGVLANQNSAYPKFNSRNSTQTTFQNGGEHTLHNWRIYNRALTAAEITQNYNALKGRFGI